MQRQEGPPGWHTIKQDLVTYCRAYVNRQSMVLVGSLQLVEGREGGGGARSASESWNGRAAGNLLGDPLA